MIMKNNWKWYIIRQETKERKQLKQMKIANWYNKQKLSRIPFPSLVCLRRQSARPWAKVSWVWFLVTSVYLGCGFTPSPQSVYLWEATSWCGSYIYVSISPPLLPFHTLWRSNGGRREGNILRWGLATGKKNRITINAIDAFNQ